MASPQPSNLDRLLKQVIRWAQRILFGAQQSEASPLILDRKEGTHLVLIQFDRKGPRAVRTWRGNYRYEVPGDFLITCDHLLRLEGLPIEKSNPFATHRLAAWYLARHHKPSREPMRLLKSWDLDMQGDRPSAGSRFACCITDQVASSLFSYSGDNLTTLDWDEIVNLALNRWLGPNYSLENQRRHKAK